MKLLKRLFREEKGVTMVEYALMIVGVAFIVLAGAILFGEGLRDFFIALGESVSGIGTEIPDAPS